MSKLSTSFTLGKASAAHGANVEHNNREFFADNIDVNRIADNITYVQQDVREAYDELFGESLKEYNDRQKRNDRKIDDYFEHITRGHREESFYEIVVQFGDSKNSPVGSESGEFAKNLLDEYMKSFEERNPNLKVFNAVLHMNEASPHLHINIIPFYTEGRQKGLSKGVSMKAALIEQGFNPTGIKNNQLVMWQDSERIFMEQILKNHGLERDVKKATHAHMTLTEYKESQDEKKISAQLWEQSQPNEISAETVRNLQQDNYLLETEKEKLTAQKYSPYKSFYYSIPEKQVFVQSKLAELKIPYRETENGFEAQECYIDEIRKLEKEFKPVKNPHRDELRNNLDRIIMQSNSYDEVLQRLKKSGYEVKQGKYISVKPKFGTQFLRLKSLGEDYSEQAIRNRISQKLKYENNLDSKIKSANSANNQDTLEIITLKAVRQYTLAFAKGVLPVRKINKKKPFAWTNDAELDRLAELNKKINAGATLESLRRDFTNLEESVSEKENNLGKLKSELRTFNDLYNRGVRCFELGMNNEDDYEVLAKRKITAENYQRITKLITANESEIAEIEQAVSGEREKLKDVSDTLTAFEKIASGTYIHSLMGAEKQRRQSNLVMNGLKRAD